MAISMDSIIKLPTPKKVLILFGVLCAIAVIYLWMLFIPAQNELSLKNQERDKLTKELNESRAITRDLPKFKEQEKKLNEELMKALTQLPNEKEIPELLKNVSTLGKESNLEFTLFRPKPEVPQQFYAKVPIELVLSGSYHQIGIFFDKISKLPRIVNVVDFNMSRIKDTKEKGESTVLVKTSCMINTYRFMEKPIEEKKAPKKGISKEKKDGTGSRKTED